MQRLICGDFSVEIEKVAETIREALKKYPGLGTMAELKITVDEVYDVEYDKVLKYHYIKIKNPIVRTIYFETYVHSNARGDIHTNVQYNGRKIRFYGPIGRIIYRVLDKFYGEVKSIGTIFSELNNALLVAEEKYKDAKAEYDYMMKNKSPSWDQRETVAISNRESNSSLKVKKIQDIIIRLNLSMKLAVLPQPIAEEIAEYLL